MGVAYLQKEDYNSAIKYLKVARGIEPGNSALSMNLAKAYSSSSQYAEAKSVYEDVIKKEPKNWDAYLELAKVCIQLGNFQDAKVYCIYLQDNNPSFKRDEVKNLLMSVE